MNPIAVYRAKFRFTALRFELNEDSIRAVGSRSSVDFDTTWPLVHLQDRFERFWIHSGLFYMGVFMVMMAGFLLVLLVTIIEMQDRQGSLLRPYLLIGTLGAGGLAVALLNARKIEHARFLSKAGIPVLDIPRDRRGSDEFDPFVALLAERIAQVRREGDAAKCVRDEAY
jgi:hypothetical protein